MGKLIALEQIQGAVAIRTDVNALQHSYDAYKVLTDIAGGTAGNYTVNELLTSLKTVVDAQLGTSGAGSVDSRIQAAKDDLQGKINTINATPIKDRVRVTGKIQPSGTVAFDADVVTAVPGIDTSKVYNLYYADNSPVLDASGKNLTYDFTTNTASGIPSVVDPADADPTDGVGYVPISAVKDIKVFPIGQFTFEQLPADYLLDNEELNTAVYQDALNGIAVDLSHNQALIDHVAALVGTQTVQNQIKTITDALNTRLTATEDRLNLLQSDATVAGSVAEQVKTAKDALQTAIDANKADADTQISNLNTTLTNTIANNKADIEGKLAAEVTARQSDIANEAAARLSADSAINTTMEANRKAAYNADQDRRFDVATINSVKDVSDSITAANGQTIFPLSEVPNDTKVYAIVNSLRYEEDVDFTINRAGKSANWTFTAAAGGFDMVAGYSVVFVYKKTDAVAAPAYI